MTSFIQKILPQLILLPKCPYPALLIWLWHLFSLISMCSLMQFNTPLFVRPDSPIPNPDLLKYPFYHPICHIFSRNLDIICAEMLH